MLIPIYIFTFTFTVFSNNVPITCELYSNDTSSYINTSDDDRSFGISLGYDLYIQDIDTDYDLPELYLNVPYSLGVVSDIELNFNDLYIDNNWLNFDFDIMITLFTGATYFESLLVEYNLYDDLVLDDFQFNGMYSTKLFTLDLVDYYYDLGVHDGEIIGNGVNNVISWFGNVWDALTNFLSLQIAPNLTIGTIITIPIVIAVLFFGLKALIQ